VKQASRTGLDERADHVHDDDATVLDLILRSDHRRSGFAVEERRV